MADAEDLKSSEVTLVWVRLPPALLVIRASILRLFLPLCCVAISSLCRECGVQNQKISLSQSIVFFLLDREARGLKLPILRITYASTSSHYIRTVNLVSTVALGLFDVSSISVWRM